jgi:large subunit ribosomal protein LP0
MVKEGSKSQWKAKNYQKLTKFFQAYDKCFVVGVDNVRSNQMQQIRSSLRGHGEILNGKNTMMRKVINSLSEEYPQLEKLLPHVHENIAFVFTKGDLTEIREAISKNVVAAPAKAGALAPCSVEIPKQNTGLGPEKTSFFQALSIPTKITRGTIEILNDVPLIQKGDKVGASEAALLNMLKIYPFTYGLILRQVYDQGSVYSPDILDITPSDVLAKFMAGVRNVAAVSLEIGHPCVASVPHSIVNGFKKLLAVSVATSYTFKESEKIKEYLADPSKFASAAPAAPAAKTTAAAPAKVTAKEEPKKEESASEEEDMGFGLFD